MARRWSPIAAGTWAVITGTPLMPGTVLPSLISPRGLRTRPYCYSRTPSGKEGGCSGALDPDTLTSRNNLACAYRAAGHPDRALPLVEEVLDQREDVLGKSHPDTLTSRNDLGLTYRKLKQLDRAVSLLQPTLAEREKVLVASDPDILTSRASLALAYQSKSRHDDAIALHERTLKDREQVLGSDDTSTP